MLIVPCWLKWALLLFKELGCCGGVESHRRLGEVEGGLLRCCRCSGTCSIASLLDTTRLVSAESSGLSTDPRPLEGSKDDEIASPLSVGWLKAWLLVGGPLFVVPWSKV